MKYIDQLTNLRGKKVFLRSDLNVPFNDDGSIADDTRIKATVPTLEYLVKNGARVITGSHMSKEKGIDPKTQTLEPVAARLEQLVGCKVYWGGDSVGPAVDKIKGEMKDGEILLLENFHQYEGEEKNDPQYAKQLASMADLYVNDAFATAHRKYASVNEITKLFTEKAAGFIMRDELEGLGEALSSPKRPLAVVFGGAKVSTKMAAIQHAGAQADVVIIGGAMANTFFAAHGLNVGKSLYEESEVEAARAAEEALAKKGCKLLLPVDVVCAAEFKGGIPTTTVPVDKIGSDQMALDIGPKSIALFTEALKSAATIIWNGPMGAFEIEEYSAGTFAIVDALVQSKGKTLVGGGDTDLALHQRHAFDKMGYVSTAGGAFLKLLEGATLPAVKALQG